MRVMLAMGLGADHRLFRLAPSIWQPWARDRVLVILPLPLFVIAALFSAGTASRIRQIVDDAALNLVDGPVDDVLV
jgi:hypothetical protein